jgi:hypothetical protein
VEICGTDKEKNTRTIFATEAEGSFIFPMVAKKNVLPEKEEIN